MQSKTTFFAHQNVLPTLFTLDDFDIAFRDTMLSAYHERSNSVADAKFYLALQGMDLETLVNALLSMEQAGILNNSVENSLFYPAGCGDTANAFCKMMTGDEMFTQRRNSINSLFYELGSNLPQLIRIEIPGHSYVMLASEKTSQGVSGYIYQSNVAYGMEDNSFSMAAWLMDPKSCKTNLTMHVKKLRKLLNVRTSDEEKATLYRELYFATPIVPVNVPANIKELIEFIKENAVGKYTTKKLVVKNMMHVLERMKRVAYGSSEKPALLTDYISNARTQMHLLATQLTSNDDLLVTI